MIKQRREMKGPVKMSTSTPCRPLSKNNKKTISSISSTAKSTANIKVVVRCRPKNEKETGGNYRKVVNFINDQTLIFDPKEDSQPFFYQGVKQISRDFLKKANKHMHFTFDRVFNMETSNQEVYDNSTMPLISNLMDGINCSVFAYGATGAGKTFTMLGKPNNPGITFLTMQALFEAIENLKNERDFVLGITYLEVYNEQVQDLLNPGKQLILREDSKFGVVVSGLKFVEIKCASDLYGLLEDGNKNRTQHPTDANSESSRSHAVFQVYLNMKTKATGEVRQAKLSMIDLAGSERGSVTGFQGARFSEGANINRSLLALGNCINSLADGHRHVPYRDSKLTRLLKDSLGGNCQTVMIANISPSFLSYEDTYNTLKYATRAKSIKAVVKRNLVSSELNIENYAHIVGELNKEIARLKAEKCDVKCKKCCETKPKLTSDIEDIFKEKKDLLNRIFQIEISEQTIKLMGQVREDANNRLSGLCLEVDDKQNRHKRLEDKIERCHKQECSINDTLTSLNKKKENLEHKINRLVTENPQVKEIVEKKEFELRNMEFEHKAQLLEKKIKIFDDEIKSRGFIIQKMATILKPTVTQLKEHGMASYDLIKDYQLLIDHCQGVKNISWNDENRLDSGVASATSVVAGATDIENVENEAEKTFVLDEKKNSDKKKKKHLNVDSLLVKARKLSPAPRTLTTKENVPVKIIHKKNPSKMVKKPLFKL